MIAIGFVRYLWRWYYRDFNIQGWIVFLPFFVVSLLLLAVLGVVEIFLFDIAYIAACYFEYHDRVRKTVRFLMNL